MSGRPALGPSRPDSRSGPLQIWNEPNLFQQQQNNHTSQSLLQSTVQFQVVIAATTILEHWHHRADTKVNDAISLHESQWMKKRQNPVCFCWLVPA